MVSIGSHETEQAWQAERVIAVTVSQEDFGNFSGFDAGCFLDRELCCFPAVEEPCATAIATIIVTICIPIHSSSSFSYCSLFYRRKQPSPPIQSQGGTAHPTRNPRSARSRTNEDNVHIGL